MAAPDDRDCKWVAVEQPMAARIMHRHFGIGCDDRTSCEMFLIKGEPIAALLYYDNGCPTAVAFHLKIGSILVFDVGPIMRQALYDKFPRMHTKNAINRKTFFSV